jgi:hypothetical protein
MFIAWLSPEETKILDATVRNLSQHRTMASLAPEETSDAVDTRASAEIFALKMRESSSALP